MALVTGPKQASEYGSARTAVKSSRRVSPSIDIKRNTWDNTSAIALFVRKDFMETEHLKGHLSNVHGAPKAYKCEICDSSFSYSQGLKNHRLVCGKGAENRKKGNSRNTSN